MYTRTTFVPSVPSPRTPRIPVWFAVFQRFVELGRCMYVALLRLHRNLRNRRKSRQVPSHLADLVSNVCAASRWSTFPLLQHELTGSYEIAYGVTPDADGNFFIGGCTSGSLDGFVSAGEDDFVVAKVSGVDGSVLWSWQVGVLLYLFNRVPSVAPGGRFLRYYCS